MGWYVEHLFPRLMDVALGGPVPRTFRQRVCAGLAGEVVEIGFGTGHNLPYLPRAVTGVRAVEPSATAVRLARARIAASAVPVYVGGLDGQHLPFHDSTADAVLSTWSLCTIPDPVAALRECVRVLRPGGALHFVEHGLAPDPGVQRWQHRLDPIQQRLGAGCHLDRDIAALLDEGGFRVVSLERPYAPVAPRVIAALYVGVAVPAR